jgi:hypothetical protein
VEQSRTSSHGNTPGVTDGPHPPEETLERYSMGCLPSSQVAPLEEHILICAVCQERLESAEHWVRLMKEALPHERESPLAHPAFDKLALWKNWRPAYWVPVLALGTLAIAILPTWRHSTPVLIDPTPFNLSVTRSAEPAVPAPAGRPLLLIPDRQGVDAAGPLAVQVVSSTGEALWSGPLPVEGKVLLPGGLPAGMYWVRLADPQGVLLREFALVVR